MTEQPDNKPKSMVPPKLDLRKSGVLRPTKPDATAPETVRSVGAPAPAAEPAGAAARGFSVSVKLPGASAEPSAGSPGIAKRSLNQTQMPVSDADTVKGKVAPKKETSKISLEAARPAQKLEAEKSGGSGPATIRIKPAVPVLRPSMTQQVTELQEGRVEPAKPAEKRKTSRISLDAVLEKPAETVESAPVVGAERVKKNVEDGWGEIPEAGGPAKPGTMVTKPSLSQTARLDLPAAAHEDGDLTRRRTIRVKRASAPQDAGEAGDAGASAAAGEKRTVRVKRPVVAPVEGGDEGRSKPVSRPAYAGPVSFESEVIPKGHWIFPMIGLVALGLTCVLVYVGASQVFGPNASYTQCSYGGYDSDLPWPGKIAPVP